MPIKYPVQYNLVPYSVGLDIVPMGPRWLMLTLKNIGDDSLVDLDVRLYAPHSYNINFLKHEATSRLWDQVRSESFSFRH